MEKERVLLVMERHLQALSKRFRNRKEERAGKKVGNLSKERETSKMILVRYELVNDIGSSLHYQLPVLAKSSLTHRVRVRSAAHACVEEAARAPLQGVVPSWTQVHCFSSCQEEHCWTHKRGAAG